MNAMSGPIYSAPPDASEPALGKTLPDLLYEACDAYDNPQALNQPLEEGWEPLALDQFRVQAEETALGLLDLGLERGQKVALLLESDVPFCIVDMGCLIAGLIDVPLYLSSSADQMTYVAEHAEARALAVANPKRLEQAAGILPDLPNIETVILCQPGDDEAYPALPDRVDLVTLEEVRMRGREATDDQAADIQRLRDQIDPDDLATIIYTSGTTGKPKGVMLSHENISSNATNSVGEIREFETGADGEVAISFLPLTHIFARMLQYSFMMRGISIYFTHPDDLVEDLPKVRPTVFASVPRVLEKVYAGIRKKIMGMEGMQRRIGEWALTLAQQYKMDEDMSVFYEMKRAVADRLVFKKWRAALGGRVRWIVVGGAALQPDLANTLAAADIQTIQGYGLTETSPVITYARPHRNKPGTVGEPIPGVDVRIADDGEILTRGPHVMKGYFKRSEKTEEVLTDDGWFHTGDVGEFDENGFLKITDRKKDLFKLSTGKYVMPQPIENQLGSQPHVDNAVVVGNDQKFCAALIFPNEDQVYAEAKDRDLNPDLSFKEILKAEEIHDLFRSLVQEANEGLDHWATVKRFALVPDELTIESGLLTPTLKVKRPKVKETFGDEIEALYYDDEPPTDPTTERGSVIVPM